MFYPKVDPSDVVLPGRTSICPKTNKVGFYCCGCYKRSSDLMLGTLRIDYERDDDDELHRERTGSRTRFTAGKYES